MKDSCLLVQFPNLIQIYPQDSKNWYKADKKIAKNWHIIT